MAIQLPRVIVLMSRTVPRPSLSLWYSRALATVVSHRQITVRNARTIIPADIERDPHRAAEAYAKEFENSSASGETASQLDMGAS
jgi:hypothetical protein